jgi:hypothetical protein
MIRPLIGLAALALLAACARQAVTPDAPQLALEACKGKLFLEVHNPLTLAIDVYEGDRNQRNDAKLVGNAPPGDTRLPIARPITRIFALDANGRGLTMEGTAAKVSYQTVCVT